MAETKSKIAIIGAHAMDAELMGGSIAYALHEKEWECYFIHITRGERGNPNKSPASFGEQLEIEMQTCAEKLHATPLWAGFMAGSVPPAECSAFLAKTIVDLELDVVITHWKGSFHPRHRLVHDCVLDGLALAEKEGYHLKGLYFGENMEDLEGFSPSLYVDISEVYETWFDAMASYELFRNSPNGFPYQSFYSANSRLRGLESGCKYARCLMLHKSRATDLRVGYQPILG
jgi:LmbE family N-acetylglucosaminyl deacetylase